MSATEVEHRLRQVGGAFVLVLVLQVNLDGRPVSALVLGPVLLALVWRVHGATLADGARLDLAPAFVVGAGALVAAGALWWPGIDPGADWDEEGGAGALVVAVTTVLFAVGVGAYASGLARWGSAHGWDDPRWDQVRRGVIGTTAGLLAYVALGPLSGPASIVAFVVGASCWIWAMVRLSQAHRELRERLRAAEAVRAS